MVRAVRAGVVLALLLAGVAVMGAAATGESMPFRTSGSLFSASVAEEVSRVVYGPVLTKARLLVSGPVGNGFVVHVWTAPSITGGRCYFDTIDHRAAAQRPVSWPTSGGGGCSLDAAPAANVPGQLFQHVSTSWQPLTHNRNPKNWVPPHVQGEVTTAAAPARVVVKWSGGSHELTIKGRYFAGGSPAIYGHLSPLILIAYDRLGRVIARYHDSP